MLALKTKQTCWFISTSNKMMSIQMFKIEHTLLGATKFKGYRKAAQFECELIMKMQKTGVKKRGYLSVCLLKDNMYNWT